MTVIFGCESDHVSIHIRKAGRTVNVKARSMGDVERALKRHRIDDKRDALMCSSSMDFPEEYTTDPNVIALVRQIRR